MLLYQDLRHILWECAFLGNETHGQTSRVHASSPHAVIEGDISNAIKIWDVFFTQFLMISTCKPHFFSADNIICDEKSKAFYSSLGPLKPTVCAIDETHLEKNWHTQQCILSKGIKQGPFQCENGQAWLCLQQKCTLQALFGWWTSEAREVFPSGENYTDRTGDAAQRETGHSAWGHNGKQNGREEH